MAKFADPVMQWAFLIMVSVVMGTCLLILVAFFRRWQQFRYGRYIHALQRQHRPALAKLLSGARSPSDVEALRELPWEDLELLLDPLLSKRRLPERCFVFLQALCVELGLIELWQGRVVPWHAASPSSGNRERHDVRARAGMRYLRRIKSMRNLGVLRHRPSWPLLVKALDDRHPEVQVVALRALAALGAPECFPFLRERLHAVVQGHLTSPPVHGLQAAMVSFDLTCAPALLPSLRHADRQIRLYATEILRAMIHREEVRQPRLTLTQELLTPPLVEWLLTELAVDASAETRARAAEVIVFLADPCATPVLRNLLLDDQWFVRLRTVQALANLRRAAAPLRLDIRQCLRDPHWQVREAAIHTLISLGPEGRVQLYEHFLTSPNHPTREQTVEVIERTGLMSDLVEQYTSGAKGVDALMVEQLASEAAPLGLSGILRTLNPDVRVKFLDRFLPYAEARMRFHHEGAEPAVESYISPQHVLNFPPQLAA